VHASPYQGLKERESGPATSDSSLTSRDSLEKHEDDGQSLDYLHHCLKGEARAPMRCEKSVVAIAVIHFDR
jgi:hypothetical protein